MAVTSADVKVNIRLSGTGDASAVVEKTTNKLQDLDKTGGKVGSRLGSLKAGFMGMADAADDGVLKVQRGFGDIVEAIGVVGLAIGGIALAFSELNRMSWQPTIDAINEMGKAAGKLGQNFADSVNKANALRGAIQKANLAELAAELAIAQASGDTNKANQISGLIARRSGDSDASGFREEAKRNREDAKRLEEGRLKSVDLQVKLADRVKELDKIIANPGGSFRLDPRTGTAIEVDSGTRREQARAERAAALLVLSTQGVAVEYDGLEQSSRLAAEALDKAASATERLTDVQVRQALAGGGAKGGSGSSTKRGSKSTDGGLGSLSGGARGGVSELYRPIENDSESGFTLDDSNVSQPLATLEQMSDARSLAEPWLDFAKALGAAGEAIRQFSPELGAFGDSAAEITAIWSNYGDASFKTANAVTASIGSLLKAGAAQVKGERERAGVLAGIELGLGFATMITNPVESASHFVGAATLGLYAGGAFGGSSGGAKGGSAPKPRQLTNPMAMQATGNVTIKVDAPFIANSQETASELHRLMART